MSIITYSIEQAQNVAEVSELIEQAAFERNCELSPSMTYTEQAEFFHQEAFTEYTESSIKMMEMVEILMIAEKKFGSL